MPMAVEGQVLSERYEVGALLGRGGMGEVRAGRDRRLGRSVAIKTLHPHLAEQPEVRRRFEDEGRAAARLSHPHVVAVFDVGEHEETPYLVMEHVAGLTLADELGAGRVEPDRALRLTRQVLSALGAAHTAGIVHRDVKPSNILLTADGDAKVTDFGIAKLVAEDVTTRLGITTEGAIGTVAYMAPERLHGTAAAVSSDLYSVGAILYEALSGAAAFRSDSPAGLVWAVAHGRRVPLGDVRPDLDPALVTAVERALSATPGDRFRSAAEMADALGAAHPGPGPAPASAPADAAPTVVAPSLHQTEVLPARPIEPVALAMEASPSGRPARPHRSRRRLGLAVAAGVAGLVILFGLASFDGPEARDAPDPATPTPTPQSAERTPAEDSIPGPLRAVLDGLEDTLR